MIFDVRHLSSMIESSLALLSVSTGLKAGEAQVNIEPSKAGAMISVVSTANQAYGTSFEVECEKVVPFAFDPQTLLKIVSGRAGQVKFSVDKGLNFQCGRLKGVIPTLDVKSAQLPSTTGTKLDRDTLDTVTKALSLCAVKGKDFDTIVQLSDSGLSCYVAAMFQMGFFRQSGQYPKLTLSLPLTHVQALQKLAAVSADKRLSLAIDSQKVVASGKLWKACFPTTMVDDDKINNMINLAASVDKVKGGSEVDSKELQKTLSSVSAVADSEAYATISLKDTNMTVEVVSSTGRVSDKLTIKAGKSNVLVRADPDMLAKALSNFRTPKLTVVPSPSLYMLREQLPDGTLTHVGAQVSEK